MILDQVISPRRILGSLADVYGDMRIDHTANVAFRLQPEGVMLPYI